MKNIRDAFNNAAVEKVLAATKGLPFPVNRERVHHDKMAVFTDKNPVSASILSYTLMKNDLNRNKSLTNIPYPSAFCTDVLRAVAQISVMPWPIITHPIASAKYVAKVPFSVSMPYKAVVNTGANARKLPVTVARLAQVFMSNCGDNGVEFRAVLVAVAVVAHPPRWGGRASVVSSLRLKASLILLRYFFWADSSGEPITAVTILLVRIVLVPVGVKP